MDRTRYRIAVIVPCHDAEHCVRRCVGALLDQDFTLPYRILLVDDSSTDRTGAIIEEMAGTYPNVIETFSCEKGNLPDARNTALKEALQCDYVCFCDVDDIPHSDFLSSLYQLVTSTGSDCACMGYREADETTGRAKVARALYSPTPLPGPVAAMKVLHDSDVRAYVWSKIYSSAVLIQHRIRFLPERFVYEDLVFSFQCFLASRRVAFSDRPIYDYLIRRGSLSHTPLRDGFVMHACAYAACRAFAEKILGKRRASALFHRYRRRMVFKMRQDIHTARKLFGGGVRRINRSASLMAENISGNRFVIIGAPWQRYIEDLGFLGPDEITVSEEGFYDL